MVTEQGNQPPEIEYLRDGENGFIVPEDDRAALRDRLFLLIDNDEQRRRMSANARRDILTTASIEGMFNGFLSCVTYLTRAKRAQSKSTFSEGVQMGTATDLSVQPQQRTPTASATIYCQCVRCAGLG